MIGWMEGRLQELNAEQIQIGVGGIGYELSCSLRTLTTLQDCVGQAVSVHVYTHVREDALQLFGFAERAEKDSFLSLLKVNGIGPKSALNILSGASPNELAQMIESEDVKALSKLPKVGRKTAEQMVLTLKGKLVLVPQENAKTESRKVLRGLQPEVSSALVNLGFRPQDVEKVVAGLGELSFEEGVRQGLAALSQVARL